MAILSPPSIPPTAADADTIATLETISQRVLWLSTYMIHYANKIRPNPDGLKVGGHQASCASSVDLMTALYFGVLRPEDHVAVKPHAAPVLHAIQYLLGNLPRPHADHPSRLRRPASLPQPHQGSGRRDYFHRLGRTRRRGNDFRRPDAALCARPLRQNRRPGALHRSGRRRRDRRGQHPGSHRRGQWPTA